LMETGVLYTKTNRCLELFISGFLSNGRHMPTAHTGLSVSAIYCSTKFTFKYITEDKLLVILGPLLLVSKFFSYPNQENFYLVKQLFARFVSLSLKSIWLNSINLSRLRPPRRRRPERHSSNNLKIKLFSIGHL